MRKYTNTANIYSWHSHKFVDWHYVASGASMPTIPILTYYDFLFSRTGVASAPAASARLHLAPMSPASRDTKLIGAPIVPQLPPSKARSAVGAIPWSPKVVVTIREMADTGSTPLYPRLRLGDWRDFSKTKSLHTCPSPIFSSDFPVF